MSESTDLEEARKLVASQYAALLACYESDREIVQKLLAGIASELMNLKGLK